MRDVVFVIPGDLNTPTGGYRYDKRVMEELPSLGWRVKHVALPGDYPSPSERTLADTAKLFASFGADELIVVDGLALGAIPRETLSHLKARLIALCHHPLAFETGLSIERIDYLHRTEREALARAVATIATSRSTAVLLAREFNVKAEDITVAEPGTEPSARAKGDASPPRLLSVGAITRRKGHDTLAKALSKIRDLEWEWRIAGSIDRDAVAMQTLENEIEAGKIAERTALLGPLDDAGLEKEYSSASLFVLPSHFEGYGMAFTEALARGLPVVAGSGGALVETVPRDAGVFVTPGNVGELALTLRRLLTTPAEVAKRADAAWDYAKKLPRWSDTAKLIAGALERASAKAAA
ncbi:MAG: glycosyltransferase family 4 protein [Xanthobacteraceae bacterium]|nr:glycosyltransferase family 4 protein [Xanthobacteraceae bacterium]QYK45754.1 MAG: glycosyltransferase family 4 protein [Xanthobacteraceae bacterium]